jgi:hypothetical protein
VLYTQPDECPGGRASRNHFPTYGFDEPGHFFVFVFYNTYYQFIELLNQKIDVLIPIQIRQSLNDEFKLFDIEQTSIRQTPSDELKKSIERSIGNYE